MRPPKSILLYDISNILFRVAAVQKIKHRGPGGDSYSTPQDLIGLCMHISLMSIYKWYRKYKPDFVIFAFEGGHNWRKDFTFKEKARTQYKGNRVKDPEMAHFYDLIRSFEEVMRHHTSIACISVKTTEADDVIGYLCQTKDPETIIRVVSGDQDFIQLLKHKNVSLVNPDDGKLRNQPGDKKYEPDIPFWTFLKCVRGDIGDYVMSAYPRVFETKVRKAFDNEFDRVNFMNTTWTDEHGTTHRVGDLFEQNRVLLDLECQPNEVRELLAAEVPKQLEDLHTYSHFHFLKFLGEYKLKRVGEEASKFIELFTSNQRFIRGEQLFEATGSTERKAPSAEPEEKPKTKTSMLDF